MREPRTKAVSWIGKTGAGMFSVDGKFGGEFKKCIQVNHMPNNPQTILVTGSAGFKGACIVQVDPANKENIKQDITEQIPGTVPAVSDYFSGLLCKSDVVARFV